MRIGFWLKRMFVPIHRVIVTWEHKRVAAAAPADNPYLRDIAIAEWCRDNLNKRVWLNRYDKIQHSHKSREKLTVETSLFSYGFIRSHNDHYVRFMDLEFEDKDELSLFLLAWVGRVQVIDAIPFIEQ